MSGSNRAPLSPSLQLHRATGLNIFSVECVTCDAHVASGLAGFTFCLPACLNIDFLGSGRSGEKEVSGHYLTLPLLHSVNDSAAKWESKDHPMILPHITVKR